jgi:CBS domain containing-hemolysin-like protein
MKRPEQYRAMALCAPGLERIDMSLLHELEPSFANTIHEIQKPPAANVLSLHSPAMEVLTDFCRHQPLMVEQHTGVEVAREMMRRSHSEVCVVIDAQERFRGVLSRDDLESQKVIREIGESRVGRSEVTVERVMTPKSGIKTIDLREFQLANIGDLLSRMHRNGEKHLIVAETSTPSVRGIVSAEGIARRMHMPVDVSERALSFSDICRIIAR